MLLIPSAAARARRRPGRFAWFIVGPRSVQARLSLISIMLFALIAGFGGLTINLFNGFNQQSDELRERWLPSTRLLGDLNNHTSDYRTAESDCLLASGPAERAAQLAVVVKTAGLVADAQRGWEKVRHTDAELSLYADFVAHWNAYRQIAARVLDLASAGRQADAVTLYRGESRMAYDAASDSLGKLTARNVARAQLASARTARAYDQGRLLISFALLLAATLLGGALAYIRHRISGPMTRLADAMCKLAANNTEFDIEGVKRSDEIGEMARAVMVFRANAIELIQSQHGLAQQAAMLEQKLAYEQRLTRLQRDFVAMISHEFRTPLAAIDAHAQRLISMRDHIDTTDLARRAGRIRSAVHRITGLMENLLTSARVMDADATLFFHPVDLDLAALLHDVVAFHRETTPNADIREEFAATSLPILGDPNLLFQTFSNLLSNAIKYSPDKVMVRITARRTNDRVTVAVSDHGLGIPRADLERLFTCYHRGGNVSGIVGAGVGLYLARTVVQLHGGEISVDSEEGSGSCFTVSLPDQASSRTGASRRSTSVM
jgi:signal transduction histidine kinase